MSITEVSALLAAGVSILAPVVLWAVRTARNELGIEIAKLTLRVDDLSLKTETMWLYQLRRGVSEGIEKGLLVKNSPTKITDKAKALYAALAPALQDFYQRSGVMMTDAEMGLAIERMYGQKIVDEICIPNGLKAASCLVIAVAIAKGQDLVEIT